MPPNVTALPREDLIRAINPGAALRAEGDGDTMPTMFGHFAVFNRWTEIDSWWEGRFLERLAPGAFKKTFRENRAAIKVLFQHGMDFQFGDKPLGPIDVLREDEIGAYDEVPLLDTPMIRGELLPGLQAGLYGASFRFTVMREELVERPDPSDYNPNGLPERTLKEVRLYEFGPVTFPAYAEAEQGVRSMTDEYLVMRGDRSGLDPERLRELTETMRAKGFAPLRAEAGRTFHLSAGRREPIEAGSDHLDQPQPSPTAPAVTPPPAPAPAVAARSRERAKMPPSNPPAAPDFSALDELRSVEEIEEAIKTRSDRMQELDSEHAGRGLGADEAEWDRLDAELTELSKRKAAVEKRLARLSQLGEQERNSEPGDAPVNMPAFRVKQNDGDIHDVAAIRQRSRTDDEFRRNLVDNALRSVERANFPHPEARQAKVREHVSNLIRRHDEDEGNPLAGAISRHILMTGSPTYRRAFGKYLAQQALTTSEQNILAETQRALALGTGSAGGFAVVYTLDPTIVPTSNSSVNPWRALARIETIAGTNEWKAVTSGAITAAYAAEATEASDNAPTLAQPDIFVEKAQAYVPFSIEAGQDWTGLQSEMATLLQDAKDDLEATKMATGAGHGSTEPKGIITAATNTTTAGGVASFAIADVYKVFEALPPRFRPRAQFAANLFIIDKIRQFDTSGGSGVWMGPQGLQPAADAGAAGTIATSVGVPLLGRNVWESTAMASALTTGSKILLVGDFRYFVIVDRVGMSIEVLPLVVGTNHRPTGQRGLYAYWRNSSDALSAAAFQVLVTG